MPNDVRRGGRLVFRGGRPRILPRGPHRARAATRQVASVAAQLLHAETDPLTGARTRSAGLDDLVREMDRARRDTRLLAVVYRDVVGLRAVNDERGHAAGDALLRRVVGTRRETDGRNG